MSKRLKGGSRGLTGCVLATGACDSEGRKARYTCWRLKIADKRTAGRRRRLRPSLARVVRSSAGVNLDTKPAVRQGQSSRLFTNLDNNASRVSDLEELGTAVVHWPRRSPLTTQEFVRFTQLAAKEDGMLVLAFKSRLPYLRRIIEQDSGLIVSRQFKRNIRRKGASQCLGTTTCLQSNIFIHHAFAKSTFEQTSTMEPV